MDFARPRQYPAEVDGEVMKPPNGWIGQYDMRGSPKLQFFTKGTYK